LRRRRPAGAAGRPLGLFESSLPEPQARFLASQSNRLRTNAGVLAGPTHSQPRSCILETAFGYAPRNVTLIAGIYLGRLAWDITGGSRRAAWSSVEHDVRARAHPRRVTEPVLESVLVGAPDHDQEKVPVQNGPIQRPRWPDKHEVPTRLNRHRANKGPRAVCVRGPDTQARRL
jgi:hypothetical protein